MVVSFTVGSFEGPKAIKIFSLGGVNDYLLEKEKLQKAYLYVIVFISILLGIGIFPVLYFMDRPEYWINIYSFFILLFSSSLYTFSDVYKLDLFLAKKDKTILLVFTIAAIINILLSFVLINLFSMLGAALANLLTNCIIFFIFKFNSKKVLFQLINV
jgi:O-antigen/teichoic acid export membrane protein